ncbi:MAG TPA: DNA-protecting protein DprA, partial [Chromatiales bacterium]|nr:DNA-protecting protein DprA [Chromatiales bacterium]
ETWLAGKRHRLIGWTDPDYPPLLREIADPPVVLFVHGDTGCLLLPQLAIVGSRNATAGGIDNARQFAAHLGQSGFCITSGLALGIDTAAHDGALCAGAPTVAVCGTGPDRIYPPRNAELAERIVEHGALVTEYPPGVGVQAHQFPRRNRLISGLSVGVLVVEAGPRSGALITARLAAEQGREVFAIPGSIHNPLARGCHRLIRNGAKLVECSRDIMDELGGMIGASRATIEQNTNVAVQPEPGFETDPQYEQLLSQMGWDPVSIDQLVERCGLTAAELSSMLLILELADRVEPLTGGRYQQRK